jgi:hypothetical protein
VSAQIALPLTLSSDIGRRSLGFKRGELQAAEELDREQYHQHEAEYAAEPALKPRPDRFRIPAGNQRRAEPPHRAARRSQGFRSATRPLSAQFYNQR